MAYFTDRNFSLRIRTVTECAASTPKLLLLGYLAILCNLTSSAQELSPGQIYEKYSSATVLIKTDVGAGTGFIVSPDGIIATAFHVIGDAKKVGVKTATGDVFDRVLLVAKDERKDVALLKIAGFDLPFVERENSNDVKVGDHVIVVGNPLGTEKLQGTVTDGIVSGVRDFGWGYKVIQLSAPISPGNSGGPVFSGRGKVIGIAAFKIVGGENLNFAVPSNYLTGLLDAVDKEHPIRTWDESGSTNVFRDSNQGSSGLTGTWKSTCGGVFQVEDKNTTVRVLNIRYLAFTYDLKWEGNVVFGTVYGGRTSWLLLKHADADHVQLWMFKAKNDDKRSEKLAQARSESEKKRPECVWVKAAD